MAERPEDGEPSGRLPLAGQETQDEQPETPGREPGANHSGTGTQDAAPSFGSPGPDATVDTKKVEEIFRERVRGRIKDSTRDSYLGMWRRFDRLHGLEHYTR